jgi:transglutaminase-like putative cysteine protease
VTGKSESFASLAARALAATDALVLSALMLTGEIRPELLLPLVGLGLARWRGLRIRSTPLFLFIGVGGLIVTVLFFQRSGFHPLVSAGHAAALLLGLLWIAPATVREGAARLSLGFLILCVAAALTPDFYLAGVILLYAISASFFLMTHSQDTVLREIAGRASRPAPEKFFRRNALVPLAVVVLALPLFPLIPRTPWAAYRAFGGASIGYSGSLNLDARGRSALEDRGEVALRIVQGNGEDFDERTMPGGLLRGTDLERFDGERWSAGMPGRAHLSPRLDGSEAGRRAELRSWEVVLEPRLRGLRFRSYGGATADVPNGLWLGRYRLAPHYARPDPVLAESGGGSAREVPEPLRASRLAPLAQQILAGASSGRDRARKLEVYFRENFTADEGALAPAANSQALLERFLFEDHRGHCELFAASAALLLRLAGTPARVVTGYRPGRRGHGGVLIVKESDAHAWVEVWDERERWIFLDPTPARAPASGARELLGSAFDAAEGLWFRWVLNYRLNDAEAFTGAGASGMSAALPTAEGWSGRAKAWGANSGRNLFYLGALILGLWVLGVGAVRLWRQGRELRESLDDMRAVPHRWALYWEARRMGRLRERRAARTDVPAAQRADREWEALYLQLRFGLPRDDAAARLERLRHHRRAFSAAALK